MNENVNKTYKNLPDAAKIVLKGKCIVVNLYIKIEERFQFNLTFYLKKLEKEEQTISKPSGRKGTKSYTEINKQKKLMKPEVGSSKISRKLIKL